MGAEDEKFLRLNMPNLWHMDTRAAHIYTANTWTTRPKVRLMIWLLQLDIKQTTVQYSYITAFGYIANHHITYTSFIEGDLSRNQTHCVRDWEGVKFGKGITLNHKFRTLDF